MILGSIINSIIGPFANAFGWVLAAFFSLTHSYGFSIVLLTLVTMIIVFPLTRAGTRSMMRMQLLQPELMKIRNKHKTQPGMSAEEKQAARLKLNEEMMALYRENGVNPTGGCLPMFLQFPIFIVLYNVIKGMTHEITKGSGKLAHVVIQPQYIPKATQLYHAVVTSHGRLESFGLNLADSVRTPGPFVNKIPYVVVILIAVVLQYVSIWQITNRNPSAAQANPQMQAVQKFMPLIFVFLYIVLPGGVGVYFIVSNLFRVGQQEYMYKHDPKIVEIAQSVREMHKNKPIDTTAKATGNSRRGAQASAKPELGRPVVSTAGAARNSAANPSRKSFRERLRDAAAGFQGNVPTQALATEPGPGTSPNPSPPRANGARPGSPNGSSGSAAGDSAAAKANQNRSRAKRPRRP